MLHFIYKPMRPRLIKEMKLQKEFVNYGNIQHLHLGRSLKRIKVFSQHGLKEYIKVFSKTCSGRLKLSAPSPKGIVVSQRIKVRYSQSIVIRRTWKNIRRERSERGAQYYSNSSTFACYACLY